MKIIKILRPKIKTNIKYFSHEKDTTVTQTFTDVKQVTYYDSLGGKVLPTIVITFKNNESKRLVNCDFMSIGGPHEK